jgi:hypothetical protein
LKFHFARLSVSITPGFVDPSTNANSGNDGRQSRSFEDCLYLIDFD